MIHSLAQLVTQTLDQCLGMAFWAGVAGRRDGNFFGIVGLAWDDLHDLAVGEFHGAVAVKASRGWGFASFRKRFHALEDFGKLLSRHRLGRRAVGSHHSFMSELQPLKRIPEGSVYVDLVLPQSRKLAKSQNGHVGG
jgi:hypothetical protein